MKLFNKNKNKKSGFIVYYKNKKLKLDKICIIFENCEVAYIPAKEIKLLLLSMFNKTMSYTNINDFIENDNCQLDNLEIDIDYLKRSNSLMGDIKNENENLFDRIEKYKDIVAIELYFKRYPVIRTYYLPWNDEDDYSNRYQKTKINKKQNTLSISIIKR